jgi:MFS family permease
VSTVQFPDNQPSVGELVRQASEHVSTLVRAEVELAKAELSDTVKRGGIGGGLLAAAGVIGLFSVPFLFVVLAEVLVAIGLWRWMSYLIVWVLFLVVAGVLALIGRAQLKKVRKPERTLETVKDTAAWARHPTSA